MRDETRNERTIIADVATRAGIAPHEARRAITATLLTLGEAMAALDARLLADALPAHFSLAVLRRSLIAHFDSYSFFDRIAAREKVRPGFAREHAQVVCEALARALSREVIVRMLRNLPAALAEALMPMFGPDPRGATEAPEQATRH